MYRAVIRDQMSICCLSLGRDTFPGELLLESSRVSSSFGSCLIPLYIQWQALSVAHFLGEHPISSLDILLVRCCCVPGMTSESGIILDTLFSTSRRVLCRCDAEPSNHCLRSVQARKDTVFHSASMPLVAVADFVERVADNIRCPNLCLMLTLV